SIIFGRRPGPVTGTPASRAATYRRTVFASTPASTAAECALPVASNASRISMISLSDFFMRPSGGYLLVVVEDLEQTPEGRAIRDRHDTGPMATDREINCPSAGKSVSAYRETDMSASTRTDQQLSSAERSGRGRLPIRHGASRDASSDTRRRRSSRHESGGSLRRAPRHGPLWPMPGAASRHGSRER